MLKLLSRHLDTLYQTILDPNLWDVFLPQLTRDVGAISSKFSVDFRRAGHTATVSTAGWDASTAEEYSQYYFAKDIWTEVLSNSGTSFFVPSAQLLNFSEYRKTEIFNDFCKSLDIYHTAGAIVSTEEGLDVRIALQRGKSQGEFDKEAIDYLNILRPHISRSLQLSEKLNSRQLTTKALETSLDGDDRCVITVDENAVLLYYNETAENLFRTNSVFRRDSKNLSFNYPEAQKTLTEMINSSNKISIADAKINACNSDQSEWYEFFISPVNSSSSIVRAYLKGMTYLIIGKKVTGVPNVASYLKTVYSLTPREIELAFSISRGESLTTISDHSHRSIHTIRTQLKSCLKKLDIKGQNNLIVFINALQHSADPLEM